jgi:uncharacterized protein YyaL (SSP411 family)
MPNALIHETSPYLLQHANNPVDWLPWSDESFLRAERENKPIFLSIGYSTCHWCHVMEHESFENDLTAALMNEHFINIKVDREERPDVDATYMAFIQATTGQGGWPMSVWLTPKGEPLLGGTYFPPEDRYGRAGFPRILREVARLWREDETKMRENGARLLAQLQQQSQAAPHHARIAEPRVLGDFFDHCDQSFDEELGGFGSAPKFPRPVVLTALMQLIDRWGADHSDSQRAWQMVSHTLQAMIDGGIHDQLGGGFHRYSVDRYWHVPHYEKMLYDQALIAEALIDAWQLSHDAIYEQTISRLFGYLIEEMLDSCGAFHAAEDADSLPDHNASHKREGAFWTWEAEEISRLLPPRTAMMVSLAWGIEAQGNARPESDPHEELVGQNTLYRALPLATVAQHLDTTTEEVEMIIEQARTELLSHRRNRPLPHRDDKIIVAWNALAIRALAKGAKAMNRPEWLTTAQNAARFLLENLWDGKILYRTYRGHRSPHHGTPADYANLISALIALHQADFSPRWLTSACELQAAMDRQFWSDAHHGYLLRTQLRGQEILSVREDYDGAEPAANHTAALSLLQLATLCHEPRYQTRAEALLRGGTHVLTQHAFAAPVLIAAYDLWDRGVALWQGPAQDPLSHGYRPRAVVSPEPQATRVTICEGQQCRDFDAARDAATRLSIAQKPV